MRWFKWYIWDYMEKGKDATATGAMSFLWRKQTMEEFAAIADFFTEENKDELPCS